MTSIANNPLSATDLTAWAQARLSDLGIAVTGEITEPQVRQWSRVLRVPTTIGPVWAKSNCPGFAYEAGLVGLLTRHAPNHVLHPLATDPALGLMLLPDGGPILSAQRQADRTIDRWAAVLREYADLQRRLEAHVPEMLAAGVPDLRPHGMPELYAEILDSPLRMRARRTRREPRCCSPCSAGS